MTISSCDRCDADAVEQLFVRTFSDSEGEAEGRAVGALAGELLRSTPHSDLYGFVARDQDELVGSIILSRIRFESAITAFLLAPVAIRTDYQRRGLGQSLIRHGLAVLKRDGIELVLTYGDPRFYGKVGFAPVDASRVPAPFPLSQPEGWMVQSLSGDPIPPIPGCSSCVPALCRAEVW
ncbi:GNAT family N-acetyltransferase [Cyanobium sp. PCC 7001]|uniref:GNAT family N-acetyltransferase n=1 Tax=Cyanobium sp. PCC 7001 TaxID=180281 RepID=UPI0008FEF195|nr:N-acetyltransferase [Cyanobium sp. PCC 7001]